MKLLALITVWVNLNFFSFFVQNDDFLNLRFKTMVKDSLNASHPISLAVQSQKEIEEMFDTVSYGKVTSKVWEMCF